MCKEIHVFGSVRIHECWLLSAERVALSGLARSLVAVLRLSTKLIGRETAVDSQWLQSGLATLLTGLLKREADST
eukprot:732211-Amphidinium_carterae.1